MLMKYKHTFYVIIYIIITRVNKMISLNALNISKIKNLHKQRYIKKN